jgi:hypothetical protein
VPRCPGNARRPRDGRLIYSPVKLAELTSPQVWNRNEFTAAASA